MVESANRDALGQELEQLRRRLSEIEALYMTTETQDRTQLRDPDDRAVTITEAAHALEPDNPEAAARLRNRIERWLERKHLREVRRLPGPHRGIALVLLSDVRALLANPPRVGRPIGYRPPRPSAS